ncbi:MAG TPA: S8 family serine peptidase [Solirubrobacterales bacterium]|nr:S8 family serine peptidase [Solirubrobacterales bacterium]
MRSPGRIRLGRVAACAAVLACLLALPALALAAFPGSDPSESPRVNTPDDPGFDPCELDDEQRAPATPPPCDSYFEEEFRLFGFSPDSANQVPGAPMTAHPVAATTYADCSQLDAQGREANLDAGDLECAQLAGVRADTAWKYSTGDPAVSIAILDTGIRWQDTELAGKIRLNTDELPLPEGSADYDANDDGRVNVFDYAGDSRVNEAGGDDEADGVLDGSDLIAAFSDGSDADGNGYVDDIAGWDWFDDDNDPFDASSCCSANGHGTGRAREAGAETDNANGDAGVCPDCQIMPLRVWDTFVVPTDNYAMATVYATREGASVVEGAVGGLTNTRFARAAFRFADQNGVALMLVSSDINSANHNYPTNYEEAIYVAGSLPDTAPNDTCSGPGGLPGLPDPPSGGEGFSEGCQEFLGLLNEGVDVTPTTQPLTTSFFRNSNLTQYGGKADIVLMGSTGSENTGQSAGAAGLLASFGREKFPGDPLSGNEIRQLLTMTAEDVLPANTGEIGQPDKASTGWDPHFGYGRVNLAGAMARIEADRVPPEAQIDTPAWFAPIDADRVGPAGVAVTGRALAPHGGGVGAWEVEYACGQDAPDAAFAPVPGAAGTGERLPDSVLGTLPKSLLLDLANGCNGEVANDAGRPAGAPSDGAWPADPYPNPDPERHAFQIRLTVHEVGDGANFGRYRKTLHAYRDDGNLAGWPRPVGTGSDAGGYVTGSGGEASPRLYDVDGDNDLEIIQATSSGELHVLRADGTPLPSFNEGGPVSTDRYRAELAHPVPAALPTPHESLRVPAIGDIDGDLEPEIVATGGEHVYAWELDGSRVAGFDPPPGVDPALSEPCKGGVPKPCFHPADRAITSQNHIKRGFIGSPALADLDGDGDLEIVAGALDQHLYAWQGDGGLLAGFPVKLASAGADGAEIVTSPAIAQLDGQGPPEIILSTNEVVPGDPEFPDSFFDFFSAVLSSSTGSNPVYAVHADGKAHPGDPDGIVDGWPVGVGVAAGDLLPLVLPGHDSAVLDADSDGNDEVSVSAATSITPGGARLVDGNGASIREYQGAPAQSPDQGPVLNLADYASVGDLLGVGRPAVVKGGLTANGVANLLAVNQNLPFSHVEQAWDPASGSALPGFPRATDDFQLLSQAAIARVGGGGPARQALVGTGMYQVHAYGPGGAEPPGWPKFTGGWNQVTPAVGDADSDGDLDVTSLTREGWSFLWDTGVPACSGSNAEWWTFHHDEHGWANYGHDARPPGTPVNLRAAPAPGGVRLTWRAPGDDWLCGKASRFRVVGASEPIAHPRSGAVVLGRDAEAAAGQTESVVVPAGLAAGRRHLAVLYRDDAGNWGHLAEVDRAGVSPGPRHGPCANLKRGRAGKDRLRGTRFGDRLLGFGGRDRLRGFRGRDCLGGGRGRDRLEGGKGRDRLVGGRAADLLQGGRGSDVLKARDGRRDVVDCGRGRDRALVDGKDVVRRCENVRRR